MKIKSTLSLSCGLAMACCWLTMVGGAGAQGVPPFINYQGVLADAQGQPITNRHLTVNFRVYDAPAGGTMIWGTRQLVTTDSRGLFDAMLGDQGENVPGAANQVQSIADVFTGSDSRWLEVQVEYNNASVMSPRQRFLTSGYAYQANNASGSQGNFTVGSVLTVKSNAVFRGGVNIQDTGQEALVVKDNLSSSSSLQVNQKAAVGGAMAVNGSLTVQGDAVFANDVDFSQSVEFAGPVVFNNGVSFAGRTQAFGAFAVLASSTGSASGTIAKNGFLAVHVVTTDSSDENTVTFTLDGVQFLFKASWETGLATDLDFKTMTLFPVKAGSAWSLYAAASTIRADLYYWAIP